LILILAGDWDPLALAVRAELERRDRDHVMLGADWARDSELAWTPVPFGGSIKLNGRRTDLRSLSGVLARHEMLVQLPTTLEQSDDSYPFFESAAALLAFLDAMPCPVVNRPRPLPRSRSTMLSPALARAAGFLPVPTVVASRREDAIVAVAAEGSPTLVGRVSSSIEDRIVTGEAPAVAAIEALLPHGAVVVKRLAPVTLLTIFVAGETVTGAAPSQEVGGLQPCPLDPAATQAARALAEQLGVQLLRIRVQQADRRLWLVDADVHPFQPGGFDLSLLAPVAHGLADLLTERAQ
jgi:hypothetical protein